MSRVTNAILTFSREDNVKDKIDKLEIDGQLLFVSIDSSKLSSGWYGGHKMMEKEIYIGALNHVNTQELWKLLRGLNWDYREEAQLFLEEQDDFRFTVYNM